MAGSAPRRMLDAVARARSFDDLPNPWDFGSGRNRMFFHRLISRTSGSQYGKAGFRARITRRFGAAARACSACPHAHARPGSRRSAHAGLLNLLNDCVTGNNQFWESSDEDSSTGGSTRTSAPTEPTPPSSATPTRMTSTSDPPTRATKQGDLREAGSRGSVRHRRTLTRPPFMSGLSADSEFPVGGPPRPTSTTSTPISRAASPARRRSARPRLDLLPHRSCSARGPSRTH